MKKIFKKENLKFLVGPILLASLLFISPFRAWADRTFSLPDQTGHAGQFLQTDGTNPLWATAGGGGGGVTAITAQNSLTATPNPIIGTGTINLVNDATAPGNSKYYGTNGAGTKGFFALTAGLVGTPDTIPYYDAAGNYQTNVANIFYNSAAGGDWEFNTFTAQLGDINNLSNEESMQVVNAIDWGFFGNASQGDGLGIIGANNGGGQTAIRGANFDFPNDAYTLGNLNNVYFKVDSGAGAISSFTPAFDVFDTAGTHINGLINPGVNPFAAFGDLQNAGNSTTRKLDDSTSRVWDTIGKAIQQVPLVPNFTGTGSNDIAIQGFYTGAAGTSYTVTITSGDLRTLSINNVIGAGFSIGDIITTTPNGYTAEVTDTDGTTFVTVKNETGDLNGETSIDNGTGTTADIAGASHIYNTYDWADSVGDSGSATTESPVAIPGNIQIRWGARGGHDNGDVFSWAYLLDAAPWLEMDGANNFIKLWNASDQSGDTSHQGIFYRGWNAPILNLLPVSGLYINEHDHSSFLASYVSNDHNATVNVGANDASLNYFNNNSTFSSFVQSGDGVVTLGAQASNGGSSFSLDDQNGAARIDGGGNNFLLIDYVLGSESLGFNAMATGNFSIALGTGAQANGMDSAAFGELAMATGNGAIAIGNGITASINNSVFIGTNGEPGFAMVIDTGTPVRAYLMGDIGNHGNGNTLQIDDTDGVLSYDDAISLPFWNLLLIDRPNQRIQTRMSDAGATYDASSILSSTIAQTYFSDITNGTIAYSNFTSPAIDIGWLDTVNNIQAGVFFQNGNASLSYNDPTASSLFNATNTQSSVSFDNASVHTFMNVTNSGANLAYYLSGVSQAQVFLDGSESKLSFLNNGTGAITETINGDQIILMGNSTGGNLTTFKLDDNAQTYTFNKLATGGAAQMVTADATGILGITPIPLGDVVGPGSAIDNALARFNGTTGKLIQNSGLILGDAGANNAIFDISNIATTDKTFVLPNASGTFAVSASGNIALSALGDITFTGTLPVANGGALGTTYTPTLTNVTNVTSSTAANCTYDRSGTTVTAFCSLGVTTTLAVATEVDVSLPIASNFGAATDLNGIGQATSAIATNAYLDADATNDRARLKFIGLSVGGAGTIYFSFSYTVI